MLTLPAALRPTDAPGDERRQSQRALAVVPALLRSLDELRPTSQQVLVIDLSLHGVGFRSSRKISVGSMFEIEIGESTLRLASRMTIVRSVLRLDGMYDIGGEFC